MGECRMQLEQYKEAIQFFGNVVRSRPKSVAGWEALIRCLFKAEFYEEGKEQSLAAIKSNRRRKPLFYLLLKCLLVCAEKIERSILQLEKAMEKSPRQLKKFIALNPAILQNQHGGGSDSTV